MKGFFMSNKAITRIQAIILAVIIVVAVVGGLSYYYLALPTEKEVIKIGYVGAATGALSVGTRPGMRAVELAVAEINAAGGILGRPVEFIIGDGKGDTTLSKEAATRLITEQGVLVLFVEGRSEIALAVQETCAELFPEYPHILIANGPVDVDITKRVLDDYDKYKFTFRDFNPEPGHWAWAGMIFAALRDIVGAEEIAILIEDLAWSTAFTQGYSGHITLPPWREFAEDYGLTVVYEERLTARYGFYVGPYTPIFDDIALKGADAIYYVSSWFTDTDTFAKQWAESAAKDIPIYLYGGPAQTAAFWEMTGGKALGVITPYYEAEIALTDKTIPFVQKCKERGISVQMHVHCAYSDVYHLKKAIEEAGTTEDIDALIAAMMTVSEEGSLGKLKYHTTETAPFYHSRMITSVDDPTTLLSETAAGYFGFVTAQFQQDGEPVVLDCWPGAEEFAHPELYKTPAELRG